MDKVTKRDVVVELDRVLPLLHECLLDRLSLSNIDGLERICDGLRQELIDGAVGWADDLDTRERRDILSGLEKLRDDYSGQSERATLESVRVGAGARATEVNNLRWRLKKRFTNDLNNGRAGREQEA